MCDPSSTIVMLSTFNHHLLSTATTQITGNFNVANIYGEMSAKINEVKDLVSNCRKVTSPYRSNRFITIFAILLHIT